MRVVREFDANSIPHLRDCVAYSRALEIATASMYEPVRGTRRGERRQVKPKVRIR